MAKKTLGYVELEWTCPTCGARNPGPQRTCSGCGAPQPDDVAFSAPQDAEIKQDEATVARATAGPDVHCPYCEARNPAGAKVCKQCGGDLTGAGAREAGGRVEGFGQAPQGSIKCAACGTENAAGLRTCRSCGAPLPAAAATQPKPQPAAQPSSGGRGCLWVAIGLVVIALVVGAVFLFSGSQTSTVRGEVVGTRWMRTIEVQGLVPVEYFAWRDQIPGDAVIGACTEDVRARVSDPVPNSREVCGTPYAIDEGTGFGKVEVDCVYEVLDQRCSFTVNEWRTLDTIALDGVGFSPQWPVVDLADRQRQGDRRERFECIFGVDGNTYTLSTSDYAAYTECTPGSEWALEVTPGGGVVRAEPVAD
jgi:ribosomal protein L40E